MFQYIRTLDNQSFVESLPISHLIQSLSNAGWDVNYNDKDEGDINQNYKSSTKRLQELEFKNFEAARRGTGSVTRHTVVHKEVDY